MQVGKGEDHQQYNINLELQTIQPNLEENFSYVNHPILKDPGTCIVNQLNANYYSIPSNTQYLVIASIFTSYSKLWQILNYELYNLREFYIFESIVDPEFLRGMLLTYKKQLRKVVLHNFTLETRGEQIGVVLNRIFSGKLNPNDFKYLEDFSIVMKMFVGDDDSGHDSLNRISSDFKSGILQRKLKSHKVKFRKKQLIFYIITNENLKNSAAFQYTVRHMESIRERIGGIVFYESNLLDTSQFRLIAEILCKCQNLIYFMFHGNNILKPEFFVYIQELMNLVSYNLSVFAIKDQNLQHTYVLEIMMPHSLSHQFLAKRIFVNSHIEDLIPGEVILRLATLGVLKKQEYELYQKKFNLTPQQFEGLLNKDASLMSQYLQYSQLKPSQNMRDLLTEDFQTEHLMFNTRDKNQLGEELLNPDQIQYRQIFGVTKIANIGVGIGFFIVLLQQNQTIAPFILFFLLLPMLLTSLSSLISKEQRRMFRDYLPECPRRLYRLSSIFGLETAFLQYYTAKQKLSVNKIEQRIYSYYLIEILMGDMPNYFLTIHYIFWAEIPHIISIVYFFTSTFLIFHFFQICLRNTQSLESQVFFNGKQFLAYYDQLPNEGANLIKKGTNPVMDKFEFYFGAFNYLGEVIGRTILISSLGIIKVEYPWFWPLTTSPPYTLTYDIILIIFITVLCFSLLVNLINSCCARRQHQMSDQECGCCYEIFLFISNFIEFSLAGFFYRLRAYPSEMKRQSLGEYYLPLLFYRFSQIVILYWIFFGNIVFDFQSMDAIQIIIFIIGLVLNVLYILEMSNQVLWAYTIFRSIGFSAQYLPSSKSIRY